jgi:hypothetical protein
MKMYDIHFMSGRGNVVRLDRASFQRVELRSARPFSCVLWHYTDLMGPNATGNLQYRPYPWGFFTKIVMTLELFL